MKISEDTLEAVKCTFLQETLPLDLINTETKEILIHAKKLNLSDCRKIAKNLQSIGTTMAPNCPIDKAIIRIREKFPTK